MLCFLVHTRVIDLFPDIQYQLPFHYTQAIWEELAETVHAVDAMVTRTPEEAGL